MSVGLRTIRRYVKDSAIVGVIMGCGDVLAQTIVEGTPLKELNCRRTINYGSLGFFVVGPVVTYWYGALNRIVPKQSHLKRTFKKMLLDQALMAPTLNLCVTVLLATLNGESKETIKDRVFVQYPVIMRNSYLIWPMVQMINFSIVPLRYQVFFVQLVAILWNVFLSDILNSKITKQEKNS